MLAWPMIAQLQVLDNPGSGLMGQKLVSLDVWMGRCWSNDNYDWGLLHIKIIRPFEAIQNLVGGDGKIPPFSTIIYCFTATTYPPLGLHSFCSLLKEPMRLVHARPPNDADDLMNVGSALFNDAKWMMIHQLFNASGFFSFSKHITSLAHSWPPHSLPDNKSWPSLNVAM